ncbi:hypothetical protein RMCBS344292_02459 [Rhizopus microsporus]|nr:hypothetical protein RMCBS344292_02459 [Rhizopus microsporus]
MATNFSPIMLHHPTSTFQDKIQATPIIEVTQRLAPELYEYEFPPRSRIMAIESSIENDDEYFDESSFTTISTDFHDCYDPQLDNDQHQFDEDDDEVEEVDDLLYYINESFPNKTEFISDHQLSPLQLPSQYRRHDREESYDSTGTIKQNPLGPSSFLSAQHRQLYLERVPEEERINWDEHDYIFPTEDHHVVRNTSVHPYQLDDDDNDENQNEGYDDNEDDYRKELPIESSSKFIPLDDNDFLDSDTIRTLAAVKIQAAWRGYNYRRKQRLNPHYRVLAGLATINNTIHKQNYNHLLDRIHQLEHRLNEETAMRIAFEKAMEDMTILMDHQHKVLHERLEHEVNLRKTYEQKMEDTVSLIKPLETRLRNESKARADMESMMSRVLDQLHDLKSNFKKEAEEKKIMQHKLNEALDEISSLKKLQISSQLPSRPSIVPSNRSPSVIPSKRTPMSNRSASVTSSIRSSVPSSRPTSRIASKPISRPVTPSANTIRRTVTPSSHQLSSTSRAAETTVKRSMLSSSSKK